MFTKYITGIALVGALATAVFGVDPNAFARSENPNAITGKDTTMYKLAFSVTGGVQTSAVNSPGLRELAGQLNQILKAARMIYREVTIQPMSLITEPEFINGVVIQLPIGMVPLGPPRPQKKRVDFAMSQLRSSISLLKNDLDNYVNGGRPLDFSDSLPSNLPPQLQQWAERINRMAMQEEQLERLAQGPPYDNGTIAVITSDIQKNAKQLEKLKRQIDHIIRKDADTMAVAHSGPVQ